MKISKYHTYNKRYFRSLYGNKLAGRLPDFAAQTPILITGAHRTGTTIIGTLLAESNEVRYIYEPLNPKDGVYMSKDEKDFGTCNVCKVVIPAYFLSIDSENEDIYIPHFKHLMNTKIGLGKRPLLKSPFSLFAAEWLSSRYAIRPIVLIRNPLAFVSSLKRMGWEDEYYGLTAQKKLMTESLSTYRKKLEQYEDASHTVIERGAAMWKALYGYAAKLQKSHPEWLFVRLEDFQANPIDTTRTIYTHVGLSLSDDTIAKVLELTDAQNPTESSTRIVHSIKRNAKQAAGNWRSRLTKEEIKTIQNIVGTEAYNFYSEKEMN